MVQNPTLLGTAAYNPCNRLRRCLPRIRWELGVEVDFETFDRLATLFLDYGPLIAYTAIGFVVAVLNAWLCLKPGTSEDLFSFPAFFLARPPSKRV